MSIKIGPYTVHHRLNADDTEEIRQLQKLYLAAMRDDLPALQHLSSQGLDFQLCDPEIKTLLHLAHTGEVVRFLLECGCDPLARDSEQSTTLMHPGLDANANQRLLAQGVNVHARDAHGNSALYRQCDFGGVGWDNPNLDALQVLLEAGVIDGNEDEIERIIETASECVTSAGESNDVATLARFLRKYKSTSRQIE
jgi:ankyrin repeat protein